MKKILITGGNGLLGIALRILLSKNNFKVIATGLGDDRFLNHKHIYNTLDISKKQDCFDVLKLYNPDIIINSILELDAGEDVDLRKRPIP